MINLLQYFKLILTKIYIYIGFIPYVLDSFSVYLPEKYHFELPIIYSQIFLILMFVWVNYEIWNEAQKRNRQPKIIIDYDLKTFNMIYLEIKNIGNDYARNIKTTFNPNIEHKNSRKLNDENFLQNIPQLAPNQKVRFLFGTFLDKKYLQKFNIKITYNDLEEKSEYKENQIIEMSSFVGVSFQSKEFDEITIELKNISKHLKSQSNNFEKTNEILKNGISIRNLHLKNYSLNEIQFLLKYIIEKGNEEDLWLNPYIYDFMLIIKIFRDKLFALEKLNKEQENILKKINVIYKYQFISGNKEFNRLISELKEIL